MNHEQKAEELVKQRVGERNFGCVNPVRCRYTEAEKDYCTECKEIKRIKKALIETWEAGFQVGLKEKQVV